MSQPSSGIKERLRSKSDKAGGSAKKVTTDPTLDLIISPIHVVTTPKSGEKKATRSSGTNSQLKFTKKGMEKLENMETMLAQLTQTVNEIKNDNVKITQVENKVSSNDLRIKLLTAVVIKQDHQISTLNGQIEAMYRIQRRPNVFVSGIIENEDEDDEQRIQKVKSFFKEQMEIEDEIPVIQSLPCR